jgi:hypothetical protein
MRVWIAMSLIVIAACGGGGRPSTSNGGGSVSKNGGPGESGGESSAGEGQGSVGGDSGVVGNSGIARDSAGEGGSNGGFSLSGTVTAPEGSVAGTQVIACVLQGTDCDAALSKSLDISARGRSATFAFTELELGSSYALLAVKDVDSSGTLSVGDYVAIAQDTAGNDATFTQSASGVTLRMLKIPPQQSSVPAELVGQWRHETISSNLGSHVDYTVNADATYEQFAILDDRSGPCVAFKRLVTDRTGSVSVSDNQITFTPTMGTAMKTDCKDEVGPTSVTMTPTAYTWRISGSSLFLSDGTSELEYVRQ